MIFLHAYVEPIVSLLAIIYGFALGLKFVLDRVKGRIAASFGGRAQLIFGFLGIGIHELSHALFVVLFHHKIVNMRLLEFTNSKDGVTLGHVDHAYNKHSIYQQLGNFFIGMGPIFGCSFFLIGIFRLLEPISFHGFGTAFSQFIQQPDILRLVTQIKIIFSAMSWNWQLIAYLVILWFTIIGFGLSTADLRNSLSGLLLLVVLLFLVALLDYWLHFNFTVWLIKLSLTFALTLTIIFICTLIYGLIVNLITRIF